MKILRIIREGAREFLAMAVVMLLILALAMATMAISSVRVCIGLHCWRRIMHGTASGLVGSETNIPSFLRVDQGPGITIRENSPNRRGGKSLT